MSRRIVALLLLASGSIAFAQSDAPPRVVEHYKLAGSWLQIITSVEEEEPNNDKNISTPGCAAVSFVIEKDGSTSTIKVQHIVPQGDLAKIAESMAKNMRFEPTVSNAGRDRVFSWLIFPFNLPQEAAARTAVMQQCQIAKLGWNDR
jgi:outer membrane biosynthesis protein TonB